MNSYLAVTSLLLLSGLSVSGCGDSRNAGSSATAPTPIPAPIPISTPATTYTKLADGVATEFDGFAVCYGNTSAESQYIFREGDRLRLTFSPTMAGIRFRLRLVIPGDGRNSKIGTNMNEVFQVPADGNLDIAVRAADFGLAPTQLGRVSQVQVRSGTSAFADDPLSQAANLKANFHAIYKVTNTGAT
jgi:hypothetical protein